MSAVNEVGEGLLSPSARITFANRPSAPASLTLSSSSLPRIDASWTAPASSNGDAVSGYRLYIDDAAGGPDITVFDGSKDQPATYSFALTDSLVCGAMYTLKVTAFNVAGESDGTSKQIKVGSVPSAPLLLNMTAIVPLATLTISWEAPLSDGCLPLRQYTINRDGVDLAAVIVPEATSHTDDISAAATFPLGTVITYKLKAVNDAGDSEYSVPLVVTVSSVPNAPSSVQVSQRTSETSLELTWTPDVAVSGNLLTDSYRVYIDDLSGNPVAARSASTPQLAVSDLVLGQVYEVTVRSVNAIGESAASSPALQLHPGLVPAKLSGTSAPRLLASTATSISLEWTAPPYNGGSGLTAYRVYYDIGQAGTFTQVALTDMTVTSYTLTTSSPSASGLTTGQIVDFYVSCVNVVGEGEPSDILTLYVAAVPSQPSVPTETSVFSLEGGASYASEIGIQVSWTAPTDNGAPIKGYKLYMTEEQSPL